MPDEQTSQTDEAIEELKVADIYAAAATRMEEAPSALWRHLQDTIADEGPSVGLTLLSADFDSVIKDASSALERVRESLQDRRI